MNPPSLHTRLMGNRLVGSVFLAVSGFITFLWLRAGCEGGLGYFSIGMFLAVGNAMEQVATYRKWQAAWDSMVPGELERKRRHRIAIFGSVLTALVALGVVAFLAAPETAGHRREWAIWALLAVGACTAGWLIWRIIRWLRSRRRRTDEDLVSVAVRRPVVPVSDLNAAYQRLPAYCQELLKGRS